MHSSGQKKNPPLRLLATPDAILFDFLRRFLPRGFYHWLLYRMLPKINLWGERWIESETGQMNFPNPKFDKEEPNSVVSISQKQKKEETGFEHEIDLSF